MFAKLIVLSIFSAALAKPTWKDLHDYSFEKFIADFDVKVPSHEVAMRKELFNNELNRVKEHNAKNLSWKEGINKFSAMTKKEKQFYYGRSKGHAQHVLKAGKLKGEQSVNFEMKPVEALPVKVDWRESGIVSAVKDQGYCGSCWAFASTATIESHVAKASGLLFDLSVQQMAMCAPNPDSCGGTGGCAGSTAELAFDYVTSSKGLYQEYQYSYASYYGKDFACALPAVGSPVATINGFVQLPENNYTALMNAIASVGPVAISVDASSWGAYESGVFSGCNQASPDIDHAVVLVGYGQENGQKYWLVRNSWSPAWGEKGYIKLARTDADEEVCGTDTTPQDGTACAGQDDAVKVCGTCGVLYDSSYPLNAVAF
eukprot:gene6727-9220_t